jgi:Iron-containing redox enzyme
MENIKRIYKKHMDSLADVVANYPWDNVEAYAQWLSQTYHYVKYSTRLLTLSSTHVPLDNLPLHNRFIDHAKEERNHEVLLIKDLQAIKRNITDYPEHYPAASLYQSQFYWIQFQDPNAFFGYILFFEGLGSLHCGTMYKEAIKHHGEKAGIFLKVHHEEDQDHIVKAFSQIEKFTSHTQSLVIQNFIQTYHLYDLFLKEAKRMALSSKREGFAA